MYKQEGDIEQQYITNKRHMHNNSLIHIGIAPGYKVTTVWIAQNEQILSSAILENAKIFPEIAKTLDHLIEKALIDKEKITYGALLAGPAPLTTLRTVCAWMQGWMRAQEGFSVTPISGMNSILKSIYFSDERAILLLQAYNGYCYWFDSNEKIEKHLKIKDVNKLLQEIPETTKIFICFGLKNIITPESLCAATIYMYLPDLLTRESFALYKNGIVLHKPVMLQPYTISHSETQELN